MNVIITGASRGLGKAIAEKFAAAGSNLLVCGRNEVALYRFMEEILLRFPGCTVSARPFDLAQREQVNAFAGWCLEHGTPGVVVNNAGQFIPGRVHDEGEGVLEQMIQVNLYAAYHLTRLLLPAMMESRAGHIFNICSVASIKAYPNGGAYSISKFALLGFSKNLREEMKPYNVKVTAVIPGAAYTDSWSESGIGKERFMEAGDVAEMVYASSRLSPQACVEEIILRPQLGDI